MNPINELLIRCGQNDSEAFRQLYQAVSPKLFSLCRRLLQDDSLAEDALQEAFVKIWNKAHTYSLEKGHAITWMTTITRNQALDKMRMANSRPTLTGDGDYETLEFASSTLSPDALSQLSDDAQRLAYCLEALKPEQRECIMQAFYYGYTHEELAERMSKPLGTVKAWIRRGLGQLRTCLS